MKASDDEGGSVLGLPEKMLKDELLVERAGNGRRLRLRVLLSTEQQVLEHDEELLEVAKLLEDSEEELLEGAELLEEEGAELLEEEELLEGAHGATGTSSSASARAHCRSKDSCVEGVAIGGTTTSLFEGNEGKMMETEGGISSLPEEDETSSLPEEGGISSLLEGSEATRGSGNKGRGERAAATGGGWKTVASLSSLSDTVRGTIVGAGWLLILANTSRATAIPANCPARAPDSEAALSA